MTDTPVPRSMLSDLIKRLLYATRLLHLYHRIRNDRTLTVVMFHRVLDPRDPRWPSSDPAYTLSCDLFERCLRFFAAHYNIVSADSVLRARRGEAKLPGRALLVTFDDGWADNVEYAFPRMQALGIPGLMFVVADAVDRQEAFYQERILGAWRLGRLTPADLTQALAVQGIPAHLPSADAERQMRQLIAVVESLPDDARQRLVDGLAVPLEDPHRHMISASELRQLGRSGVAVGLHGKTHVPLTRAEDLGAELEGAREAMMQRVPDKVAPSTMSFPHGRHDAPIVDRAHRAGFEMLFTSVPALNATRGTIGNVLGRLGFESGAVADASGRFRPERLALYLFRRPHLVGS